MTHPLCETHLTITLTVVMRAMSFLLQLGGNWSLTEFTSLTVKREVVLPWYSMTKPWDMWQR